MPSDIDLVAGYEGLDGRQCRKGAPGRLAAWVLIRGGHFRAAGVRAGRGRSGRWAGRPSRAGRRWLGRSRVAVRLEPLAGWGVVAVMFAEAAVRQVARDEGRHPGARGSRKRPDPGRTAYWAALSPFNRLVMNVPARIAMGPNATPAAHPPLPVSTSTNATAKHPAPRTKAIH